MITKLAVIAMAVTNSIHACEDCGGDPLNLWVDFDSHSSGYGGNFGHDSTPTTDELLGATLPETEDVLAGWLNESYDM